MQSTTEAEGETIVVEEGLEAAHHPVALRPVVLLDPPAALLLPRDGWNKKIKICEEEAVPEKSSILRTVDLDHRTEGDSRTGKISIRFFFITVYKLDL